MESDWTELERARQQKEDQASLEQGSTGEQEASPPQPSVQDQAALDRLGRVDEPVRVLAAGWNPTVRRLLEQIAAATWGETPAGSSSWSIEGKIIWRDESQTPSLYWEALHRRTRFNAWYGVELRTDMQANPVRFVITCSQSDYTISSSVSEEALKDALVQAFRLGPQDNIFHTEMPGIPI